MLILSAADNLLSDSSSSDFIPLEIVGFVRKAEKTEVTIAEFCRQKGFNEGTLYKWKKRFGSMQVAEVKRLRELEAENARLKRILADRMIEIDAMQELLAKKW